VRKTAAICVAKLYDLKPELVLENGFLEQLHEMISDSNPMVRTCAYILFLVWSASLYSNRNRSSPPKKGRREHRYCARGYSHVGDVAAVHFLVRSGHLHRHPVDPEQTPHRAQRMLRVGPRRYTLCASPVRSEG
jgi:hypothetical protein